MRYFTQRYNKAMEFSQEKRLKNSIISYQNKNIHLADQVLSTPCFLSKTYQVKLDDITLETLRKTTISPLLIKDNVSILLIGTGDKQSFLVPQQHAELHSLGIGIEIMPNISACRCYNLLLLDYRAVGLLLL